MRFGKVYVEITNKCNLSCSFCHGTSRPKRDMSTDEFSLCLDKIKSYTKHIYLHVMGEPLTHPKLQQILNIAYEKGVRVNITTNGTLLHEKGSILHASPALDRVNISLHAFEANGFDESLDRYLDNCIRFSKASDKLITCFRLWNRGGLDYFNENILMKLHLSFPNQWEETRKGFKLSRNVYLEYASLFDWPDLSEPVYTGDCFCYGLRDQCAVLSDGTVVPCCLDADGQINLGNLLTQSMDEILSSARAQNLYEGFSRREAREVLCQHCDYLQRYR